MKTKLGYVALVVMLLASVPAAVGADGKSGVSQGSTIEEGPVIFGQPYTPSAGPKEAPTASGASVVPWRTIFRETFEGAWPWGPWAAWDGNGAAKGAVCWDDQAYAAKPGIWSAWCADNCANGRNPFIQNYAPNMDSWMRVGPFNLSGKWAARYKFNWWNQSEFNFDRFWWCASHDWWDWSSASVRCGWAWGINRPWPPTNDWNWATRAVSLNAFLGDPTVYLAFVFQSDNSVELKGAFVDQLMVQVKP
jgi:hypothetical protein